MPEYFAALTMGLLVGMVFTRVLILRRHGIEAMNFGKLDRTDFVIPPFAIFYIYLIFANAFGLPTIIRQEFFQSGGIASVGVVFCLAGLILLLLSLISFGQSFRVGIDTANPDKLITTGIFAFSRNPIYVAFASVLFGQFLIFPNWIFLISLCAGIWLFHRQVIREESYLKDHYGLPYLEYCSHVRRYI